MRTLALLPLVCLLASPASAQDTFKQVWVTQSESGEILRGRIVQLSQESLAILTPDNRRIEMPLDRVLRIEARGDSLKNGAAIGAAVLGGLSLLGCQGANVGQCAAIVGINTGMGALIGAGADALNGGRSVLYRRPAAAPGAKAVGLNFKLRF